MGNLFRSGGGKADYSYNLSTGWFWLGHAGSVGIQPVWQYPIFKNKHIYVNILYDRTIYNPLAQIILLNESKGQIAVFKSTSNRNPIFNIDLTPYPNAKYFNIIAGESSPIDGVGIYKSNININVY